MKAEDRRRRIYPVIIVVLLVVILLLLLPRPQQGAKDTAKVAFLAAGGKTVITADIADEIPEWTKGLQSRSSMAEDSGMLFVFQKEGEINFWMKDMEFPLDMIFIGSDMKVRTILKNAPVCSSDPCVEYPSKQPVLYVAEVNAGFADRHGIQIGDSVEIEMNR